MNHKCHFGKWYDCSMHHVQQLLAKDTFLENVRYFQAREFPKLVLSLVAPIAHNGLKLFSSFSLIGRKLRKMNPVRILTNKSKFLQPRKNCEKNTIPSSKAHFGEIGSITFRTQQWICLTHWRVRLRIREVYEQLLCSSMPFCVDYRIYSDLVVFSLKGRCSVGSN